MDKEEDKEFTEDDNEVTLVFVVDKEDDREVIFGEVMLLKHIIPE
jgi:hypothetical protein